MINILWDWLSLMCLAGSCGSDGILNILGVLVQLLYLILACFRSENLIGGQGQSFQHACLC